MAIVRHPIDIYTNRLPDNTGSKILLLEDIQDPGNVGTLIRTASAFDLSGVIMSEKCADPLSSKSVQSTAGSVLSVWIRKTARYLDLAVVLKERGYYFITADINGVDQPFILDSKEKLLLALGNEASGPSKQLTHASDLRLRIPINQQKAESLNVAAIGFFKRSCATVSGHHSDLTFCPFLKRLIIQTNSQLSSRLELQLAF